METIRGDRRSGQGDHLSERSKTHNEGLAGGGDVVETENGIRGEGMWHDV